jgi:hypothetical protein
MDTTTATGSVRRCRPREPTGLPLDYRHHGYKTEELWGVS